VKVHKLTVIVIDFDKLGADGVVSELTNARFANDCINPRVLAVETRDCGRWHDNHPLNLTDSYQQAIADLFGGQGG